VIFAEKGGVPKLVAVNWGSFEEESFVVNGTKSSHFNGAVGIKSFTSRIMKYIEPVIRGFYTHYGPGTMNPLVRRHATQ
jgi:hypothetical protein